jgi:UDP-GlcNAc:undecaprenyl-phosphate GlcNAc-1-phosphate transferase
MLSSTAVLADLIANGLAAIPSATWTLLAFGLAFATSVVVAPIVARLSVRLGIVDAPDNHRKLHRQAIPLTGGPVLLISLAVSATVTLLVFPDLLAGTSHDRHFLLGLFLAASVIVIIGMLDDRFGMRGRQKLAGQVIAATVMVLLPTGVVFDSVSLFGQRISFGDLSVVLGPTLALIFLVGAINALNLIDGVDGLASTTGVVLSLSVACVAMIYDNRPDGLMISLILAGSLLGFLIYNFPPARMFLGDSGSMLIGLILGAVALKCSLKGYTTAALILPTAIWAIPLFDASMAILRRKLTGRSIYETDRGHLHHCLERKGLNGGRLLVIVAVLCGTTGLGAIAATQVEMHGPLDDWLAHWLNLVSPESRPDLIAVVGVLTAISLLVVTRSFGHTEMSLLSNRLRRLSASMLQRRAPHQSVLHDEKVQLHGDHNWQELWETLTDFAERFEMDSVELMVNLPKIGEEYHASWRRKTKTASHEEWKSEIPLIVEDMRVGYIRVVGAVGDGSICKWMSDLIGGLQSFEDELVMLIRDLREQRLNEKAGSTAARNVVEEPAEQHQAHSFAGHHAESEPFVTST